jgi:hypothetical protein
VDRFSAARAPCVLLRIGETRAQWAVWGNRSRPREPLLGPTVSHCVSAGGGLLRTRTPRRLLSHQLRQHGWTGSGWLRLHASIARPESRARVLTPLTESVAVGANVLEGCSQQQRAGSRSTCARPSLPHPSVSLASSRRARGTRASAHATRSESSECGSVTVLVASHVDGYTGSNESNHHSARGRSAHPPQLRAHPARWPTPPHTHDTFDSMI